MALPALAEARADAIVVARPLASLVELAALGAEVLPLERGPAGMIPAVHAVRSRRFERGILLTPSFSSALLFRSGRVRWIRGSATDGRTLLLNEAVPRADIDAGHRVIACWLLVTGAVPSARPVPVLRVPESQVRRWHELWPPGDGPAVGFFPGGNASARRWPPERFAEVVAALASDGVRTVVFGGPAERDLARSVARGDAFDAGGRTDLPLLAAALASCDILVTNDSGPMHLAAAVGTPTLSLFGAGNPASTGPTGPRQRVIRRADLTCVPCVKNVCPRRGQGDILQNAERECLNLITTAEVLAETRRLLAES